MRYAGAHGREAVRLELSGKRRGRRAFGCISFDLGEAERARQGERALDVSLLHPLPEAVEL